MKGVTIPCIPVYSIITEEIEDSGLEVTKEIMSLCRQIEQELLKQTEMKEA